MLCLPSLPLGSSTLTPIPWPRPVLEGPSGPSLGKGAVSGALAQVELWLA